MTDSLAERALCVIESRLKAIRTEDGFSTGAGLNVLRARASVADTECPVVVVWDGGEQPDGVISDVSFTNVLIVAIVSYAAANQTSTGRILEKLKADVKRALLVDVGLNDDDGQIGALSYLGATPVERRDGASIEGIVMTFHVTMKENVGEPDRNS